MAKPFNEILKKEQEKAKADIEQMQADRLAMAKRHRCPVCKMTMDQTGCLTINPPQGGDQSIAGNYCTNCYSQFLAKNVPKFVEDYLATPETPKLVV